MCSVLFVLRKFWAKWIAALLFAPIFTGALSHARKVLQIPPRPTTSTTHHRVQDVPLHSYLAVRDHPPNTRFVASLISSVGRVSDCHRRSLCIPTEMSFPFIPIP